MKTGLPSGGTWKGERGKMVDLAKVYLKQGIRTSRGWEGFGEGIRTSKKRLLKDGVSLEGKRLEDGIGTLRREGLRSRWHLEDEIRTLKAEGHRGENLDLESKGTSRRELGPQRQGRLEERISTSRTEGASMRESRLQGKGYFEEGKDLKEDVRWMPQEMESVPPKV